MFVTGFTKVAKVFIYRNIRKGKDEHTYSLRQGGKVTGHHQNLLLQNATFKVSEKGRGRVLSEGVKNVHAGITGDVITSLPQGLKWTPITYDPKVFKSFVTRGTKEPVNKADFAKLTPRGVEVATTSD